MTRIWPNSAGEYDWYDLEYAICAAAVLAGDMGLPDDMILDIGAHPHPGAVHSPAFRLSGRDLGGLYGQAPQHPRSRPGPNRPGLERQSRHSESAGPSFCGGDDPSQGRCPRAGGLRRSRLPRPRRGRGFPLAPGATRRFRPASGRGLARCGNHQAGNCLLYTSPSPRD